MTRYSRTTFFCLALSLMLSLTLGCGDTEPTDPSTDGHGQDAADTSNENGTADQPDDDGPLRTGPHDGTLVRLGEGALQLELTHDPASGRIEAWLLDAAGDDPAPVPTAQFDLELTITDDPKISATPNLNTLITTITLESTTPDAETHHHFTAEIYRLQQVESFHATLVNLPVDASTKFSDVTFVYPDGN